jgi:hypothetical protein
MLPTDSIEHLKQDYTDKYVEVDANRPELARFRDYVGQVKTVNMNGRALVQFQDYNLSTGWFDIDLGFLKVVDKPTETAKPEKKHVAPAKKAETEAKEKPATPPKAAPAAGKLSVAEMLAAARGGAATKPASPPAAKAATPKAAAPAAKGDAKKMSTADILAKARGEAAPAAKAPAEEKPAPEPVAEKPAAAPEPKVAAPAAKAAGGKIDKKTMSIDQMVAYCREYDAK